MFKGFSQRAQKILAVLSQDVAKRFHSDLLLPEHILLAMIREGQGSAFRILRENHIDHVLVDMELEKVLPVQKSAFIFGDVPPSRRCKVLLETAQAEARTMGSEFAGTEHILLACLLESESPASRILMLAGLTIETVRNSLRQASSPFRKEGDRPEARRKAGQAPSRTPILDEFARDLTAYAREGRLDPVIGRTNEIKRVVQILARRNKNNPILVGEPGVGKTAIVEGLAARIVEGDVPDVLADKRVLTLDLASVIAGTKYRGEFEDRMKRIMKEIFHAANVILFIDELHTIIGAGSAEGTVDASNILKPALSRGEIQCIGATTLAEYRKYFEKDAALERRFQTVLVNEATPAESLDILRGIQGKYEDHHGVTYTPEAVAAAVSLSKRYVQERFLPDKAIDLLDEAGSKKKIENGEKPAEFLELEEEVKALNDEKMRLVQSQDYERAASVRDEARKLRERIESLKAEWETGRKRERMTVTEDDIRSVVSETTGIPLSRLEENETGKLLSLEAEMHRRVIGQDDAIGAIASSIRRSRSGISDPRRPLGSFMFLGPTGVGKTLLAKTLAEYLFGSQDDLVRIDMSDFMEKHNVSRLVGAPPGYVGYDEGGMLTERIRRKPYSVVLFDEIEKAHVDVFNVLLQVLEEGELKDSLGHTVSFRNCVIIMTSNAGAREITKGGGLGFRDVAEGLLDYAEIKNQALAELKRVFSPEFVNRLDDIVVFHALDRAQVEQILGINMAELSKRLSERGIAIELKPAARDKLVLEGYDVRYGARPMRRLLQSRIEDMLSMEVLSGRLDRGMTAVIDVQDGQFTVKARKPVLKAEKIEGTPEPVKG